MEGVENVQFSFSIAIISVAVFPEPVVPGGGVSPEGTGVGGLAVDAAWVEAEAV